jgi:hypothetical protein
VFRPSGVWGCTSCFYSCICLVWLGDTHTLRNMTSQCMCTRCKAIEQASMVHRGSGQHSRGGGCSLCPT